MKQILVIVFLCWLSPVFAQPGYAINVTLKPFKNQYIYLGHYSGKQYPVIDSIKLDEKSQGVFKGKTPLGGGIYLIAYPSKDQFIEVLIDKQQHFSVIADTAKKANTVFVQSTDNELFAAYQQQIAVKGKTLDQARKGLQAATNTSDSANWNDKIKAATNEMAAYRKQLIKAHPNTILSTLLHLMDEPQVPPAAQHPGGKYDSSYAYRYFKDHYWDGINFWDDRISRTPAMLFDERLDKYFNTLVFPAADSVNKELDWMLGYASINKEMTRYLLVKFITRYMNMKYMWEDAVFVHLYQKYFANKQHDWLTEQGKKMITEKAYNLMANILGNPAENIALPDSSGNIQMLYADTSRFTVVTFWDPTCGHCKELMPVLDSLYRAKWKAQGVHLYAIGKETDGTRKDWLNFINKNQLQGWTHVYYTREEEKRRVNNGIPGYTQLYDAQTVPAVFLLDRDKRIIAKKLGWEQVDEIITLKLKKP